VSESILSRLLTRLVAAPTLDDAAWQLCLERAKLLQALPPTRRTRLRDFAARFLKDKAITPVAGLELRPWQRTVIAAQACLPCLQLGYGALRGWHEVIVYPGQFGLRRHHHDEETGVVTEWDDELAGEAWERGPIILSWADIEADLDEPEQGLNVILHEIAHKLDALDGALDGTPPLPDAAALNAWVTTMQSAFDALCAELEAQREPVIDPYAADCPEEFFAVVSEYHWSAPAHLAEVMPAVAEQLRRFYGPSPFAPA
jgi:hypothetical protein